MRIQMNREEWDSEHGQDVREVAEVYDVPVELIEEEPVEAPGLPGDGWTLERLQQEAASGLYDLAELLSEHGEAVGSRLAMRFAYRIRTGDSLRLEDLGD